MDDLEDEGHDHMHGHADEGDTNVRVAVRCRPYNDREKAINDHKNKCIDINGSSVVITGPNGEEHSFAFDNVFDMNSTQPEVWENVGLPILDKAFSGYNGTIFAYGQTGSGKTWSMQGADGDLEGVIPRMNNSVFERIKQQKAENSNLQFLVTASYFELYNEIIFDLLDPTDRKKRSKSGLEIKEHPVLGVYVKGLQEIVVDNPVKMQAILDQGMKSRTVASTQMNADSSRSHSVFTIKIHQKDSEDESKNLFAKVNLVDLAGSERVKSTGATGATLKEGANINKSLSALGNVINALVECAKGKKGVFVPYRNSKLTRVLQESLGGNSITVMVAAISPAMCNFEETLSTLKYANRAKAIKVKAIKNDESSQISRLNEEIRMLKEKLMSQHSNVDTSLLEAKHQQQLRDLEEAMKSTWEEKARISQDHERERAKLEREQQEAQKLLNKQREDSWRLLETKGDVELSISHVKDLLRVAQPDGGIDRISSWTLELRDILKLESELSEQYTVIDVYQSSLLRDSEMLLKDKKNSNLVADKMAAGQWKQLRDKFEVISNECLKWIKIRSSLINSIEIFLRTISNTESQWQEKENENIGMFENSQVSRGFQLVHRQVQEKYKKSMSSSSKMISIVSTFTNLASKVESILDINTQKLKSMDLTGAEEQTIERQKIISDAMMNISDLKKYFGSNGSLKEVMENGFSRSTTTGTQTISSEESMIQSYQSIRCSNRTAAIKKAAIGSMESWVISSLASIKEDEMPYVEVTLPNSVHLTTITIQGGLVPEGLQSSSSSSSDSKASTTNFTLPCGLGFNDCNGAVEHTVRMISDVISWETLIKKNPPEKFLIRPPVRFFFDLILYMIRSSNLSVDYTPEEMNWDLVGANKDSKMNFVGKILNFVSNLLKIPSPTTSAAIVSGADATQTNIFLQHLSMICYCSKEQISLETITTSILPPPQISPRALERIEREKLRAREMWVSHVIIAISEDGQRFHPTHSLETCIMGANDIFRIPLDQYYTSSRVLESVKYIRIYAASWTGSLTCMRFGLFSKPNDDSNKDLNSGGSHVDFQSLLQGLYLLKNSSDILTRAINFLILIQELETSRKQDEVRKRMENLADEKLLLEQRLASEKLALNTEKQGLEEQLRVALTKLHEAEQLLEQEKTLSLQYEALHQQVVNENHGLQQSLHEQMEHNNELQSQLMKLQASSEKDYVLIENYRKRIEEDDEKILNLNDEIEKFKSYQVEWENEKDDLLNQITILTDERDSARQHEEELYSILKEKTNDLERLQESYVDMTDRCNDYQDSMAEMREEMESLKEVMLAESRQFITASQSATALRPRNISDPSHYPSSAMDSNPPNTTYSSHTTREEYSQEPSSASLVSSLSVPPTIHSPPSIISEPYISPVHNPSLSSEETTKPQAAKATAAAASKASTAYEEEYAADDNDYEEEFEDDFES